MDQGDLRYFPDSLSLLFRLTPQNPSASSLLRKMISECTLF
jgi:hypothetical protein